MLCFLRCPYSHRVPLTVRRSLIKNSYYYSSYTSENIPRFPTIDEEMENDVCKVSIGMDNSFIIGVGSKYTRKSCDARCQKCPTHQSKPIHPFSVILPKTKEKPPEGGSQVGDVLTLRLNQRIVDHSCAVYEYLHLQSTFFTACGQVFSLSRDVFDLHGLTPRKRYRT